MKPLLYLIQTLRFDSTAYGNRDVVVIIDKTPAPLPSPESLTFGDFLVIQTALIHTIETAKRRAGQQDEFIGGGYSKELSDSSVKLKAMYLRDAERLEPVLSKLQACFGRSKA